VDPSGGFPNLRKSTARVDRQRPAVTEVSTERWPSDLPKRSSGKPSTSADGSVVVSKLNLPFAPKAWRLGLAGRR
jgi:hypothetical protein